MWRETTKHERNLRIFREELDEFLPETILDFHVHLMNPGIMPAGQRFSAAGHEIDSYTIEDLKQDLGEVFPGRRTMAVCFGFPARDYDRRANDRYVAQVCDGERFFGLRLLDPHEQDPDRLGEELIGGRFFGIKPYPDYVKAGDLSDVEIHQMLPAWAMRVIDDLGLLVMLHIPRPGRLADRQNQRQLRELCQTYPNAKIIMAHIGRAYYLKNVLGHLDGLKDLPNLYYDLTMLNHWEVLEHTFQTVRADRIVYGSDIPISLAPGKSVEINDQYTYVTPVPWKLSISDDHRKLVFTSFLYEELRAIKRAVQRLGLPSSFVRGVFFENGVRLLNEVRQAVLSRGG